MSVAAGSAGTPAAGQGAAGRFRAPSRAQLHAVIAAQRILACAPPDPAAIFQLLAETAWSVLGCTGAIASQPVSDAIVVRGLAGETPDGLGATIPIDGTLTGVALRTRSSQISADWVNDPRTDIEAHDVALSFVVVPLVYEGEVIALIGAHSSRIGAFDEKDLELLAMLADVGAKRLAHTLDITEHEEATKQLAASEQHFRLAFDNAPIGMSMISLAPGFEGRYLQANAQFCAMLGYTPEELADLTMPHLTHGEDLETDRARFARITSGEVTSDAFDKRFRRKDGETAFAWLTSSVAHGPTGEPLYLITHAVDMTKRRQQQAELERLALTDTLTGLANRTLLTDRLDQALARLQRVDGWCALLLIDIDRFKLVNDSLGHQVGDALLVEVAGRIEDVSRADSTVARLGGDEFVVLAEGLLEPDDVHGIAARLLETLRRPYIIDDAADSLVVTVSIGISVATTADRSHGDLYREADLALYRAKDSGRDRYALFDTDLRSSVDARMKSESLLRRALAEGHVTPFFQPLVDLTTGRIRSVECLARIVLPGGGIIAPVDFVEVAEETGLIVELDARMFELGMRAFSLWTAQPDLALRSISTNVSARSLEDPTFVDRIRRAMTWYGVKGSAIRVEITERSLLASSPVVVESLRRIAGLGIDVGLDDFGTGYSALSYLQRFDLMFLKIDRAFVSQLGNPRDDAVVAAVIDLAHALELRVVAEGVETYAQLELLREMGCERAQGFLMGRPLPAEQLIALVRTRPIW